MSIGRYIISKSASSLQRAWEIHILIRNTDGFFIPVTFRADEGNESGMRSVSVKAPDAILIIVLVSLKQPKRSAYHTRRDVIY